MVIITTAQKTITLKQTVNLSVKALFIFETVKIARHGLRPFFASHARTSHVQISVHTHTCAHLHFMMVALRTRTFFAQNQNQRTLLQKKSLEKIWKLLKTFLSKMHHFRTMIYLSFDFKKFVQSKMYVCKKTLNKKKYDYLVAKSGKSTIFA